jgi:uncharacterized membrane protein
MMGECKEYRLTLLSVSLSLSLYLHDYITVQYATLPLPYYHHASTAERAKRVRRSVSDPEERSDEGK